MADETPMQDPDESNISNISNISANVDDDGNQHGAVEFGKLPAVAPAPGAQATQDLRAKAEDAVHQAAARILSAIEEEMRGVADFHHPVVAGLRSTLGQVTSFLRSHLKV